MRSRPGICLTLSLSLSLSLYSKAIGVSVLLAAHLKEGDMNTAGLATVLFCSLAFLGSLGAQTIPHAGSDGQSYTITRVARVVDPAPLSDDSPGQFNSELAQVNVGPWSVDGAAHAYDQLTGYDASAEASNWHHSEWTIVANGAPAGFILSVGGKLIAGGWVSMDNPPCSAFAACAHSAKVSLRGGKNEGSVQLSGGATSAAGLVNWGQFTLSVELAGVRVGWSVTPVFAVHQTGEFPLSQNGAAVPQQGREEDSLDAWGVGDSCTLKIQCGANLRTYADGWWVILAWNMARARAYAVTNLEISVGGRPVAIPLD